MAAAFVIAPGEGETMRGPAGGPATVKVRTETSSGSLTFIDNVIAPGAGPPRHLHHDADELFYILEGHLHVEADGQALDAPAGATVFIPRGVPHVFQNIGTAPARLLVFFTPAGMERFFEGIAGLREGPVDPQEAREIARSASMEILGPPLPPPVAS
jgi:quercetin dioxygenase-like cupin family protein